MVKEVLDEEKLDETTKQCAQLTPVEFKSFKLSVTVPKSDQIEPDEVVGANDGSKKRDASQLMALLKRNDQNILRLKMQDQAINAKKVGLLMQIHM